ncbi:hypothetical protein PRZ48_008899 [Zasmidium cellare]|uniref:Uncharacterized protein n=1 Tax=Zasmidium cellare TaxID=395010 RepID=A0ABR0EHF9_ZASCE|nr:hypothetical protein PRZ48_008899 [Zasmidium cellare]
MSKQLYLTPSRRPPSTRPSQSSTMEANKRNAMLCLTRARNVFMDTMEVVYLRKVQSVMDEILTPAVTSSSTTSGNTANASSPIAASSSNITSPLASANHATDANATPGATNALPEISTNEQAQHLILEAWDYFELAEDYTSADIVKKLGEEVFGEDAWGSAVVKYVDEDAITKHPGVQFSASPEAGRMDMENEDVR